MENIKNMIIQYKKRIAIIIVGIICIGVGGYFIFNQNKVNQDILKAYLIKDDITLEFGQELKKEKDSYFNFKDSKLSKEEQKNIVDNVTLDIKVEYLEKEDGTKYLAIGDYDIVFTYKEKTAKVKLKVADTTPPTFNDVNEVSFEKGKTNFDFNSVILASDLQAVTIEYNVDTLDVNTPNEYTIKAIAKDASQNSVEKEIKVVITDKKEETTDNTPATNTPTKKPTSAAPSPSYGGSTGNSELDGICDTILNSITTPSASKTAQARATYNWVESNIRYSGSTSGDWVSGAINAFKTRRGNCYAFAYTSKALLTRLGIENILIHDRTSDHYWNMVNIGGWYHFDTTTGWGQQRFLWTNKRLKELKYYSPILNQEIWYDWDETAYPTTP